MKYIPRTILTFLLLVSLWCNPNGLYFWLGVIMLIILIYFIGKYTKSHYEVIPSIKDITLLVSACVLTQAIPVIAGMSLPFIPYSIADLKNSIGYISALCLSLIFSFFLISNEKMPLRIFSTVYIIIIGLAIYTTHSGLAVLCLSLTGVYALYKTIKRQTKTTLLLLALSFLLCSTFLSIHKNSLEERSLIWKYAIAMIKDKPITGFGNDGFNQHFMGYQANYFLEYPSTEYTVLTQPPKHVLNEYLMVTVSYGLSGLVLLFSIIGGILYLYIRKRTKNSLYAFLPLLFLALFSIFSTPFSYAFTWIISIICIGLLVKENFGNQPDFKT